MKRVFAALAAIVLSACGDESPSVATTISLEPSAITFDAVGAAQTVVAEVKDQRGNTLPASAVAWSSSNDNATVASTSSGSAIVTAVRSGASVITASSGAASASLDVSIAQRPSAIEKISGDNQAGVAGRPLQQPLVVRVVDRLGAPISGQSVTFNVGFGGGFVSPATAVSNAGGVASTVWTLGPDPASAQRVVASVASTSVSASFDATVASTGVARIVLHIGSGEVALAGTQTEIPPTVLALDNDGRPVPDVDVSFTVTAGGGAVASSVVRTNRDGFAINPWTLGPVGTVNRLSAAVAGIGMLEFKAFGCDNVGRSGFSIALCYRTPVTEAQRKAFVDGAERWTSIIVGDLPDTRADASEGACEASSPPLHMTIDDLLVFVSVEPIDGEGQGVSQAGWCFRRDGGLPLVGTMRFDSADIGALEATGRLLPTTLHNLGHAVGVGTVWALRGLVQNPTTPGSPVDSYFSGANAIAAFDAVGGTSYAGRKVPVENVGGAGTVNTHWRESVFANELMSSVLDAGANPLSLVTVRSLEDIGYTVDRAAADPFTLTTQSAARIRESAPLNDAYAGPQWTIDARGRVSLIRRP